MRAKSFGKIAVPTPGTLVRLATGIPQQVKEFTVTGTYALLDRVSGWLELRNDSSNQAFFNRGNEAATPRAIYGNQPGLRMLLLPSLGPFSRVRAGAYFSQISISLSGLTFRPYIRYPSRTNSASQRLAGFG